MKKSLFLLPLLAGAMLCGCGETPTPTPTPTPDPTPAPEPEHTHTFSAEWSSNSDKHWHMATCGHDVKSEEGAHVDANSDQKCDVCAYPMPVTPPPVHTHTFAADWSSDKNGHWHDATCGHDVKSEEGAHVDANADYKCDVCGFNMDKPVPAGDIVLDFSTSDIKDSKVFPFVQDVATLNEVVLDGVAYNSKGTFADCYKSDNTYYLSLKNKLAGDGKVESGEDYAFIGNADSFDKAIKSVEIEVSKQTGGVDFYVAFGASAFTEFKAGSLSGGTSKTVSASTPTTFTINNPGTSEYFGIAATRPVGQYRKNGGIAKITIHF